MSLVFIGRFKSLDDITKFAEKPSDEEMREALQYRINGYQRLNTLDEIKNGKPESNFPNEMKDLYYLVEDGLYAEN